MFRPFREAELLNKDKKNNPNAKPFHIVLMFKILILVQYYFLSGEQVEYNILSLTIFYL